MSDDNDSTQEIPRDPDRYSPAGQQDSGAPRRDRSDDTAVLGHPRGAASPAGGEGQGARQLPGSGQAPGAGQTPAPGSYPPPGGGYRPAADRPGAPAPYGQPGQPAPAASWGGAPMLPTDRGSGGFPAAIIGAVVATLIAAVTAFGAHQILTDHSSIDNRKLPGFVTYRMYMLPWPAHGGDLTTAFVVGALIVLVVTLLLMMAATMSTRAGTGGFAVFLAGWMATVIAGGIARPVAGVITANGSTPDGVWQNDLSIGVQWGVLFGWIAALVLVIVHAMRRKGGVGRAA